MAAKKVLLATMDDPDRISSLPDGILCYILSFLPTIYSVRTSVLSTRWQHLFSFVPTLNFELSWATNPSYSPTSGRNFLDFVNSVIILYKANSMDKFRFRFLNSECVNERCLTSPWISAAIYRHVKEIDICIDSGLHLMLPRELFSCKTLTKLRLWGKFNVFLPRSACLPCLRHCEFQAVCFNDDSALRFVQICPVLEHLHLTGFKMEEGVEILIISAPTLKHLYLDGDSYSCKIFLNLPNLLSFHYMGEAQNEFVGLGTLKSLVDFYIHYEPGIHIRCDGVVVDLIRASCHVQRLHLSCYAMEAFLWSGRSLPMFNNLTRLSFDPISSPSSRLLENLLDNSPRLEFLSFFQAYLDENYGNDHISFVLPDHVPACVALHLRKVKFRYTSGMDYDRELIKYFLKNAKNLEKMIIQSNLIWNEQFEISSPTCQLVFRLVDADDV